MSVLEGFEALTHAYLGQDWELFGATPDEVLVNFTRHHSSDVPASVVRLESLLASPMSEVELGKHWFHDLHSGYDPREDGFTFREWFAHARDVLQAEAARRGG